MIGKGVRVSGVLLNENAKFPCATRLRKAAAKAGLEKEVVNISEFTSKSTVTSLEETPSALAIASVSCKKKVAAELPIHGVKREIILHVSLCEYLVVVSLVAEVVVDEADCVVAVLVVVVLEVVTTGIVEVIVVVVAAGREQPVAWQQQIRRPSA